MPWWGKSQEAKPEQTSESNTTKHGDAFDASKLPDREKLPRGLQKIVDKADADSGFFDDLREGYVPPSTNSNLRYAAYANRFRTILLSAQRYVAYTSDIGESFRPVAHPYLVRAAYGISWLYIIGDVSHEGYKAYWQNQRALNPHVQLTPHQQKIVGTTTSQTKGVAIGAVPPLEDWRTVVVQRGIFQGVASMGLPALTIHSIVRYSGKAMKDIKNPKVRTWGPIGLGLAVVPILPTLFDQPVEQTVEWIFHRGFETFGGKAYVGDAPTTGRESSLSIKPKKKEE